MAMEVCGRVVKTRTGSSRNPCYSPSHYYRCCSYIIYRFKGNYTFPFRRLTCCISSRNSKPTCFHQPTVTFIVISVTWINKELTRLCKSTTINIPQLPPTQTTPKFEYVSLAISEMKRHVVNNAGYTRK